MNYVIADRYEIGRLWIRENVENKKRGNWSVAVHSNALRGINPQQDEFIIVLGNKTLHDASKVLQPLYGRTQIHFLADDEEIPKPIVLV